VVRRKSGILLFSYIELNQRKKKETKYLGEKKTMSILRQLKHYLISFQLGTASEISPDYGPSIPSIQLPKGMRALCKLPIININH
jgi:hypothetical protein